MYKWGTEIEKSLPAWFFTQKIFTRKFFLKKKSLPAIFFLGICPQFFFKKKSLKLSLMGGLRRVQMGGLGTQAWRMGGLRDGVGMGGLGAWVG